MFKRKTGPKKPATSTLSHLFHGIAIRPGENACDAALALSQERFLSEEAPRLPLTGCSKALTCSCVYRHFSDRRTDVRREADLGLPPRYIPEDQRYGRGRRVTDDA
ncbi:MAG: hypothetical protein RIC56_03385 [Pseudomonadales bacterium]